MNNSKAVVRQYNKMAKNYDKTWKNYLDGTIDGTVERLNLDGNEKLLDVGCGTGLLLQKIRDEWPGTELYGIDISDGMLDKARNKNISGAVFETGLADDLPFENNYFDIIVTSSSFHYWPNPDGALKEINRVLRPDGVLVITDWCRNYATVRIASSFLSIFDPAHVRVYYDSELMQLAMENGFDHPVLDKYKINWFWGIMTLKAQKR